VLKNPFNGIEREVIKLEYNIDHLVGNPFNGIERRDFKHALLASRVFERIHSMELKVQARGIL